MFLAYEVQVALKKIEKLETILVSRGATIFEEQNAKQKIHDIRIKYNLNHVFQQKTRRKIYDDLEAILKQERDIFGSVNENEEINIFDDSQTIVIPVFNELTGDTTWWVNGHEFFSPIMAQEYAKQREERTRQW